MAGNWDWDGVLRLPDGTYVDVDYKTYDDTVVAFADAICNAIRAYASTDEEFAEFIRDANSFGDLYDMCDASEFIVAAEHAIGRKPDLDTTLAVVSERLRNGEQIGEPERQIDIGLRVIVSANDTRDVNAIARAVLKALAVSTDDGIAGMYFDVA